MKRPGLLFIIFLQAFAVFAGNVQDTFDKGLRAANNKSYAEAIDYFQTVVDAEPENASAYYNMGNCYFELKQYGMAIWAFEKSLQREPGNANTLKNLEVCHFQLELPTYAPIHSGFARSIYGFGSTNWSYLAIIAFVLTAVFISASRLFKRIQWKRLFMLTSFFMLLLGALLIFAAAKTAGAEGSQGAAIVIHSQATTYLNEKMEVSPVKLKEGTRILRLKKGTGILYSGILDNGQEVLVRPEDIKRY